MIQDQDGRLFVVLSRPQAKLPDVSERMTSGPTAPRHDITLVMSRVGFPSFMEPEYENTRRTTPSTPIWAADMTEGLLHALNWAEFGGVGEPKRLVSPSSGPNGTDGSN